MQQAALLCIMQGGPARQYDPETVSLDQGSGCMLMPDDHLFCRRPTAFCSTPLQYRCHCATCRHSRKQAIPSRLRRMTTMSAACSQVGPQKTRSQHLHRGHSSTHIAWDGCHLWCP